MACSKTAPGICRVASPLHQHEGTQQAHLRLPRRVPLLQTPLHLKAARPRSQASAGRSLPLPPMTCRLGYFSLMYLIMLIWKMEFP